MPTPAPPAIGWLLSFIPPLPHRSTNLPHAKISPPMKTETIHPAKALSGPLELPGDKSISHRYAMLAALAEGTSELRNFAAARDCHSTLGCMNALGADVKVE